MPTIPQLQRNFTTVYHMVAHYRSTVRESEQLYNDRPLEVNPILDKWIVRITKVCQTSIQNTIEFDLSSLFTEDFDLEKPQTFCAMVREPTERMASIINHANRDMAVGWGVNTVPYDQFTNFAKAINIHSAPQHCLIPFRKDTKLYRTILSRLEELSDIHYHSLNELMDWDFVLNDLDVVDSILKGIDNYTFYKMKGNNAVNDFFIDCVGVQPEVLKDVYRKDNHYDNKPLVSDHEPNFAPWCQQQKMYNEDTTLWRLAL